MAPLFTEYAMQSETWAAIGFPVDSEESARDKFYEYSGWVYQFVVVLISRSSGTYVV